MTSKTLYWGLFNAWKKLGSENSKDKDVQQQVNDFWKLNMKSPSVITLKIQELEAKHKKRMGSVAVFFQAASSGSIQPKIVTPVCSNIPEPHLDDNIEKDKISSSSIESSRPKPAQEKLEKQLKSSLSNVVDLQNLKDKGLISDEQKILLKKEYGEVDHLKKSLKRLQRRAATEKNARDVKKQKIASFVEKHPELEDEVTEISVKDVGRPTLETQQPLLLKTIVDIVTPISGADDRRRTETLRACMTLNDLHSEQGILIPDINEWLQGPFRDLE